MESQTFLDIPNARRSLDVKKGTFNVLLAESHWQETHKYGRGQKYERGRRRKAGGVERVANTDASK